MSNNNDVWNGDSRTLLRSNVFADSASDGESNGGEKDYVIRNAKYSGKKKNVGNPVLCESSRESTR